MSESEKGLFLQWPEIFDDDIWSGKEQHDNDLRKVEQTSSVAKWQNFGKEMKNVSAVLYKLTILEKTNFERARNSSALQQKNQKNPPF